MDFISIAIIIILGFWSIFSCWYLLKTLNSSEKTSQILTNIRYSIFNSAFSNEQKVRLVQEELEKEYQNEPIR